MPFPLLIPILLGAAGLAVIATSRKSTPAPTTEERGNFLHRRESKEDMLDADPFYRSPAHNLQNGLAITYSSHRPEADIQYFEERMFTDATENPGFDFFLLNADQLSEIVFDSYVDGVKTTTTIVDPLEFDEAYALALGNVLAGVSPE